ncbi:MAG: signal transduction histidine kinase, LytS, partial [Candidatus Solibacter sp.]|nr:signal transduction histidine kinase, LytS [Candidatus Solibacter sp.]
MHPIFAARVRVLLYLAGWIPVLALLSFVLRSSGGITWLDAAAVLAPAVLIFAFACLSPWPICRVRPLRIANIVPLIATWAGAAATSAGIFVTAAWASGALQTRPAPHLDILFALGVILYLLSAGLHYAALAADASRAATLAAAEANSLARDAELYALRMQINPHFLFNSLHSIAALTTQDAARAREMCLRLSDFLRGSLALADHKDIPLGEELALARAYLDVEHIRFGARLQFHEEIGAACDGCRIPALLLQPLIENAVKHGIAGLIEGGSIRLAASRSGDVVHIAIENPYDPESISPTRLGVGLPQVRRRMQVRYGDAATLSIDARDSTHRVTLTFPC